MDAKRKRPKMRVTGEIKFVPYYRPPTPKVAATTAKTCRAKKNSD